MYFTLTRHLLKETEIIVHRLSFMQLVLVNTCNTLYIGFYHNLTIDTMQQYRRAFTCIIYKLKINKIKHTISLPIKCAAIKNKRNSVLAFATPSKLSPICT